MRFPEFTEEWKKVRVSNLLDFYPTNSLSWEQLDYSNGQIKNLHYGLIHKGLPTMVDASSDLLPYIKEEIVPKSYTLFKEGDVSFADASEDTNDVAKAIEILNCNGQQIVSGLHTIHGRDNTDQTVIGYKGYAFASESFHKQIRRIAQGTKVFSVSVRNFDETYIGVPSKDEQAKIAKLLIAIDKRIATQTKIIEDLKKLKSAICEKLFSSPKDKQPQIRLYGFFGDWHFVRLSDICHRICRKNTGEQCKQVLTIAAQYGLVSQEEFFNKNVASENLSGYYLLQKGDFAYNKSYSGDYVWGTVKRLDNYEQGVLSPLYICFRPDPARVDSDFLIYYFESKKWHKTVANIAGEGARNHGLLNISVVDYFNTIHCIPSMDEQKQIAQIIGTLLSKIAREQRMLNCYAAQRQYLLRQMFI
ncbi:restriction endonuclease subunit S [Phocaeicola vulgatus]|uniref:restriction endonuclease subunit S n=1 Tax=Phocaeicola vulgatus TaxID=821 RepID=UPI003564EC9E